MTCAQRLLESQVNSLVVPAVSQDLPSPLPLATVQRHRARRVVTQQTIVTGREELSQLKPVVGKTPTDHTVEERRGSTCST